ncbi:MAG: BMP family ABC transporter substrate-binding protein [Comamonas sp.]
MTTSSISPRKNRYAVVLFGPEGQGSFNESGLQGARKAQAAGFDVDVLWVAGQSAEQRAQEMAVLCGGRYALILAHGGQGDGPVKILAQRWPSQAFVVTQGSWSAANVARYEVLQEQSAFLAGVLASQWSKTGAVGHFSGEKVPPGLRGRAAYADGVRSAGFKGRLLTQFCGHQHQPDWARHCVADMIEQTGLDIVFAMIDGGRPGVTQACRQYGVAQIGNVLDWVGRDPEVFVASAICNSGEALFRAIEDHENDVLHLGGYRAFGLEEPDLVRLALGARIDAQSKLLVEEWAHRLVRGEHEIQLNYSGAEFPLPQAELAA